MGEIDWGKVSSGTRELFPAGTYRVECTGWEECEAKTGTPQIRFFLRIVEPEEYLDHTTVDHAALTPTALWKLASITQGFGLDMSNAGKMEIGSQAFNAVLDSVVNRTAFVQIEQYQYNDNTNNKISTYLLDPSQEIIPPKTPSSSSVNDTQAPF